MISSAMILTLSPEVADLTSYETSLRLEAEEGPRSLPNPLTQINRVPSGQFFDPVFSTFQILLKTVPGKTDSPSL